MTQTSDALLLRPATPDDVPLILTFVKDIAEYEHLSDQVAATEGDLRESLFAERPAAECVLAFWDGRPAGYAVFFYTFSTFVGRRGLYLEDLFVRPEYRKRGIGKALLRHLAAMAVKHNCGRFEWTVLDWNTPAIDFYQRLGARPLNDWTTFRVDGEALSRLADR